MFITADEPSVSCAGPAPEQGSVQHNNPLDDRCKDENMHIFFCCTWRDTVLQLCRCGRTGGGPYVSADEVPELGEIHPFTQLRRRLGSATGGGGVHALLGSSSNAT